MDDIYAKIIRAVADKHPAIVYHLSGRAALIYCEHKAAERDPDEPGRDEKMRLEKRMAALILRRFKRQLEKIEEQLETALGRKAITVGDILVEDDGEEEDELVRLVFDALLTGSIFAQEELGIYLADGALNAPVLEVARSYVTEWLQGLDRTSQNAVRDAIETFITRPGTTVGDMVDILAPTFGDARALRIAVTETTRVYARADELYAQGLQVEYPEMSVEKTWWTNSDDRVCPLCGPLHGKTVKMNEPFDADGTMSPPRHVNCRCWRSTTVKA